MNVVTTRSELEAARKVLTGRVSVVMTMGALHAGHVELIRRARAESDAVVVTIFLNPLQFAPGEDLDRYPRTLESDLALCASGGADVVFTPTPAIVYETDPVVRVSAGHLGDVFEGASRPGHFDGVVTVVLKLLHLTRPDLAYFGRKDAQQLACIRRMVRDLDVPVDIVAVPTVREPSGLAMSSRNLYLTGEQRVAAASLHRALATGSVQAGLALLAQEPGVAVDYLERVDEATFAVAPDGDLLIVAARVGSTRLIDNRSFSPGTPCS